MTPTALACCLRVYISSPSSKPMAAAAAISSGIDSRDTTEKSETRTCSPRPCAHPPPNIRPRAIPSPPPGPRKQGKNTRMNHDIQESRRKITTRRIGKIVESTKKKKVYPPFRPFGQQSDQAWTLLFLRYSDKPLRYLLRLIFSIIILAPSPPSGATYQAQRNAREKKAGISAAHQTPEPNKRPKRFQNRVCVCRYLLSVKPRDSSRQSDACGGKHEAAGRRRRRRRAVACLLAARQPCVANVVAASGP